MGASPSESAPASRVARLADLIYIAVACISTAVLDFNLLRSSLDLAGGSESSGNAKSRQHHKLKKKPDPHYSQRQEPFHRHYSLTSHVILHRPKSPVRICFPIPDLQRRQAMADASIIRLGANGSEYVPGLSSMAILPSDKTSPPPASKRPP